MVVFSNKAYNAIIRESFDKDPVETGGILLGHILDNGVWIVMEVLPPGIKCIFERAYFEYDDAFVNYLAQSVANQYKIPLELLGLWHRHPGSMDVFSSTDDGTNTTFALQNPSGVISGLVNIDPQFRLTMYHMENPRNVVSQYYRHRPNYERIDIEVGDDIIPEEYFQLKYYDGEGCNLNPFVERSHTRMSRSVRTEGAGNRTINEEPLDIRNTIQDNLNREDENYVEPQDENPSWMNDLTRIWEILKKNKIMSLIALILVIVSLFSFKTAIEWGKSGVETVISWFSDVCQVEIEEVKSENPKSPIYKLSAEEMTLEVNKTGVLTMEGVEDASEIEWTSDNSSVATISNGEVTAIQAGTTNILASIAGKSYKCKVKVEPKEEVKEVEDVRIIIPSYHNSKKGELSLSAMTTYTFVPRITGNAVKELIQFSSDNPEVATITNSGKVTLKALGTVKITVSYNGEEQDTFMLTIKQ